MQAYFSNLYSTRQPNVTLDNMSCQFNNMANLRLTAWNGSTWKDLGNGGTTGTTITGTIKTTSTNSIYGYYTLATTNTFRCVKCEADAGIDAKIGDYPDAILGVKTLPTGTYFWTPTALVVNNGFPITLVSPSNSTIFKLSVTNINNCIATDEVEVLVFPRPLPILNHGCIIPISNQ